MNASSTLTKLIQSHRWEEVISKCKTVSSEEYLEQNPRSNRTPLHMVCSMRENQIPISVIEALLFHGDYDKAMRMKDKQNKYLPLHCAIRYKAPLATISLLVKYSSPQLVQDLRIQSEGGSLSILNLAIRRRSECSIIEKLVQLHPEAVKLESNANWTPLHEAIWHRASIETIKLLVELHPKALLTETITSKQTPLKLYWSHFSSNPSKETISLLLKATSTVLFEEAASFPGMIHVCLEYFKHQYYIPGLLEYLLDNYPEDTSCRWVFILLHPHCSIHIVAIVLVKGMQWLTLFSSFFPSLLVYAMVNFHCMWCRSSGILWGYAIWKRWSKYFKAIHRQFSTATIHTWTHTSSPHWIQTLMYLMNSFDWHQSNYCGPHEWVTDQFAWCCGMWNSLYNCNIISIRFMIHVEY